MSEKAIYKHGKLSINNEFDRSGLKWNLEDR